MDIKQKKETKNITEVENGDAVEAGTNELWDLVFGVVLLLFSIYVFFSGLKMIFSNDTGTDVWYYSPGFYPAFLGICMFVLSGILLRKKAKVYKSFVAEGKGEAFSFGISWNNIWLKIVVAILLLAVYVFGLIGRIHFSIATFIYLFLSMAVFRPKDYEIWKIILISLLTAAFVFCFFTYVAKIPLP